MINRLSELRCKEVINLCDGCRIGYVTDAEIDTGNGRVVSLILPGPCRFFGLFGRDSDYVIPWECIRRIGEDIILVEVELTQVRKGRKKRGW